MKRRWPILLVLALVGVAWILHGAYRALTDVETGVNVAPVSWLPPSAHNISFYRSYSFTACEFDIAEQDFLKWAKRWDVKRIDGEPVGIPRHYVGGGRLRYPEELGEKATEAEIKAWEDAAQEYAARRTKLVTNGYYYNYRSSNGGGVTVAYDIDEGRAYYESSPR